MTQLSYQESVMLSYSDNNAHYKVKCLAMGTENDIIPTACGKKNITSFPLHQISTL